MHPFAVLTAVRQALSLARTLEDGAYATLVMLIGLGVVGYSYRRHRQRQLIRDTPTVEVESMAVGAVELAGTVEAAEQTVPALLTDQDCAVVVFDVEEYQWTDDGKEWRTQDSGVVAEPFYLDDGTGRALVDTTDRRSSYDISEANRTRERYDDTGSQPATVAPFLTEYTTEPPASDRKRRYTEHVVPVGAEAYVYGDAEPADAVDPAVSPDPGAADLIVTRDADTEMFLVSDKTETELAADRRYSLALGGLLGIAVFSAGLWWLLSVLGI